MCTDGLQCGTGRRIACQITFNRSPRRPRKQNRWPPSGSRFSTSCTRSARLAKPFLMSVWPVASHTRTPVGNGIIANVRPTTPPPPPSPIFANLLASQLANYPMRNLNLEGGLPRRGTL